MSSSSDESEFVATSTRPELLDAVQRLSNDLRPATLNETYNTTYENFLKWKTENKAPSFSEDVLLAYFGELAQKNNAGTLWVKYYMLKRTLKVYKRVKLEEYKKLKVFLKGIAEGYVPKKTKILTREHVDKFINEAPDNDYLATKVAFILSFTGALREQELCDLTVDNIENQGEMLLVNIPNTKNGIPRSFVISGNYYKIVKKYQSLRFVNTTSNRFFQHFKNGKCIAQVIGKHKLGSMPKEVAEYLNLPDALSYTAHSFRRTSATLLADSGGTGAGVDQLLLKGI